MTFERIEPSPEDKNFRKIVKWAIDSAKCEIIVVAGELGSYGFPELKQASTDALGRGVRVRVYATIAAPADVVDEIKQLGGEIYIGEIRVKDHYLMIDRETLVISEKEEIGRPTDVGTRKARVYKNNPEGAQKILTFYDDLIRSDFMNRTRRESKIGAFATTVFRMFVPSYEKPIKEPEITAFS